MNTTTSRRSTAWENIVTHSGFRTGFADVRMGIGWPNDDLVSRGDRFRWWYEYGRLFAASHYSRRWKTMPASRKEVTKNLLKSLRQAQLGGVWPRDRED